MCPSLHIDTTAEHESCTVAFDFKNHEDGRVQVHANTVAVKFVDRAPDPGFAESKSDLTPNSYWGQVRFSTDDRGNAGLIQENLT